MFEPRGHQLMPFYSHARAWRMVALRRGLAPSRTRAPVPGAPNCRCVPVRNWARAVMTRCGAPSRRVPLVFASLMMLCSGPVLAACMPSVAPTPLADVVITREQFGSTVTVKVGQTFTVQMPSESQEWQLDFSTPPLELLTPPNRRQNPGASGWRFVATSTGESEIGLTLIPKTGDAAPPRVFVTIRVTA